MNGIVGRPTAAQERRWSAHDRVGKDLQQTVFCTSEAADVVIKGNPHKFAKLEEKGVDPYKMTTCPFCLSFHRVNGFFISTKKGIDRGRGRCPVCGTGMKLQTLVKMIEWADKSNKEGVKLYAAWVYAYRSSGFWQKIAPFFETFKKHLRMMGWSREFWDEYKRLKGDLPSAEQRKKDDDAWAGYEESLMHV